MCWEDRVQTHRVKNVYGTLIAALKTAFQALVTSAVEVWYSLISLTAAPVHLANYKLVWLESHCMCDRSMVRTYGYAWEVEREGDGGVLLRSDTAKARTLWWCNWLVADQNCWFRKEGEGRSPHLLDLISSPHTALAVHVSRSSFPPQFQRLSNHMLPWLMLSRRLHIIILTLYKVNKQRSEPYDNSTPRILTSQLP